MIKPLIRKNVKHEAKRKQNVDKMQKICGTYPGNIYGIYKECITNISIDIYDKK